jgi:CRP-like cAMP-binding protein
VFNIFRKTYSDEEKQILNFLGGNALLGRLSDEELNHIAPHLFLRTYQQDEVVFFANDPSQALYIVKSGSVSISLEINNHFEELLTLQSGQLFGENVVLESTKRLYSAIVTSENAEINVIPKINLIEVMDNNPTIKAKIMTSFGENQDKFLRKLFNEYKSSLGFFELANVYQGKK